MGVRVEIVGKQKEIVNKSTEALLTKDRVMFTCPTQPIRCFCEVQEVERRVYSKQILIISWFLAQNTTISQISNLKLDFQSNFHTTGGLREHNH